MAHPGKDIICLNYFWWSHWRSGRYVGFPSQDPQIVFLGIGNHFCNSPRHYYFSIPDKIKKWISEKVNKCHVAYSVFHEAKRKIYFDNLNIIRFAHNDSLFGGQPRVRNYLIITGRNDLVGYTYFHSPSIKRSIQHQGGNTSPF